MVDQLEELFTLCRDDEERRRFIDVLLDSASNGALVLTVLRADFYGHAALLPRLAAVLEEQQALVGPMTEEELRRVIERPAEQARRDTARGSGVLTGGCVAPALTPLM